MSEHCRSEHDAMKRHKHLNTDVQNVFSRVLLLATGLWKPNIPTDIQGIEHAVGYEDMTIDPDFYSGKNVLILGNLTFNVIHSVNCLNISYSFSSHNYGTCTNLCMYM